MYKLLLILFLAIISIYLIYKKINKEEILINKNLCIINNKKLIDFNNLENLEITELKFVIENTSMKFAIISLKINFRYNNFDFKINGLENSIKILRAIKKYNYDFFKNFLNRHFTDTHFKNVFESEIDNEYTGI